MPDYVGYITDCGDKAFGHYAKGEATLHQFTFEAVQACQDFPLGCRTLYRAYSSDLVHEIFPAPTPAYPGVNFQARQVEVLVHPQGGEEGKPAGIYLLQKLPPPDRQLGPMPLVKDSRLRFEKVKEEISKTFHISKSHVVDEWNAWDQNFVPQSDDAFEFITR